MYLSSKKVLKTLTISWRDAIRIREFASYGDYREMQKKLYKMNSTITMLSWLRF